MHAHAHTHTHTHTHACMYPVVCSTGEMQENSFLSEEKSPGLTYVTVSERVYADNACILLCCLTVTRLESLCRCLT